MPLFFPISHQKQGPDQVAMKSYEHKEASMNEMKFTVSIPGSFNIVKKTGAPPTIDTPVTDCVYFKSETGDVEVLVQCAHIQYEVSLEHYYQHLCTIGGETIVEKRRIGNDEDKPDLLAQKTFPDGQTWISRRTGYKIWNGAGAFVITISAATNTNDYVKYATLLYAITSSLQPVKKPEWQLAERLLMVTRRHPVDFATYIPVSWKEYHHHSDTMDEMNLVYTKTLRQSISGMLSMCCVAEYKIGGKDAILQKCHKGYIEQGADLSNIHFEKTEELEAFSNVLKGSADFIQNDHFKSNITFYLAKKGTNWVYLEMFGPAKETDFEAWSLNDRAFEIMKERIITA